MLRHVVSGGSVQRCVVAMVAFVDPMQLRWVLADVLQTPDKIRHARIMYIVYVVLIQFYIHLYMYCRCRYICITLCVCMYVCMYVCTYVCMYTYGRCV